VRVGILAYDANNVNAPEIAGLKQGLAALGYVDGQTIAFELRDAAGNIGRLKMIESLAHVEPGLSRVAFVTSFDPVSGSRGAQGPSGVQFTTAAASRKPAISTC
jgi:hypothetical protein